MLLKQPNNVKRSRRRRIRDRAWRAAQSVEQRQRLLQYRRESLDAESGEQREAWLQQMSELAREQLAAETAEQREARLQQVRERLASETEEQREITSVNESHLDRRYNFLGDTQFYNLCMIITSCVALLLH